MKNGRPVTEQEKQEIAQALDGAREELGIRVNIGAEIHLDDNNKDNIIAQIDSNDLQQSKELNNNII